MEKAKALNLKNMKEALVNCSGSNAEMSQIFKQFQQMAIMGFITRETYNKFFKACAAWYVTDDYSEVRDRANDDALVWEYRSDRQYTA